VVEAMKHIPRASSLVENLNSRLRNYFSLRRQLGAPELSPIFGDGLKDQAAAVWV
jgi:hypothetical protein